jgi:hypothetical protein
MNNYKKQTYKNKLKMHAILNIYFSVLFQDSLGLEKNNQFIIII